MANLTEFIQAGIVGVNLTLPVASVSRPAVDIPGFWNIPAGVDIKYFGAQLLGNLQSPAHIRFFFGHRGAFDGAMLTPLVSKAANVGMAHLYRFIQPAVYIGQMSDGSGNRLGLQHPNRSYRACLQAKGKVGAGGTGKQKITEGKPESARKAKLQHDAVAQNDILHDGKGGMIPFMIAAQFIAILAS